MKTRAKIAPLPQPAQPPAVERDAGAAVALRLAIGRDGLGIELARNATIACIDVVELVVRLPNVRFPFDVTGGITKFRHRRGELERLAVELDARRVARFAEPLLRGLLGTEKPSVTVAPRAFGATVTVLAAGAAGADHRGAASSPDHRALAFEVAILGAPDLVLVVHGARGANLPAPATALALKAMAILLGEHARREGARFILGRAAANIARALLPDAGVRAPGGGDVVLAGSGESDGVLFIAFARAEPASGRGGARGGASAAEAAGGSGRHGASGGGAYLAEASIPRAATLAHEAALLTRAGDDARFAGDYDRARAHDLATMERAPRHAEIGRRIAEVDAHAGGRAEAAIATLRATDRMPYQGQLLGDLLVEAGDLAGAIAALLREGERDPSAAVSALVFARAARLATDAADALSWLDAAIARAPSLVELRWERAEKRLTQGRLADARADFQELEAIAVGAAERYRVLRRAADAYRAKGLGADAALLYERALLYRPDDPDAVAGLGIALAAEGRVARGATLLARAIELEEATTLAAAKRGASASATHGASAKHGSAAAERHPTAWMQLALARVLGDRLNDRPAAVARLRLVPDEAAEAIDARGLEGRYRAVLGDDAGASLAFARLRERAGHDATALPWLDEAATFEEGRGELTLAQAHLAAGLAIMPSSHDLEARYRAVSARIGRAAGMSQAIVQPEVRIAILPAADVRERTTMAAPPDGPEIRERVTLNAPAMGVVVISGHDAKAVTGPEIRERVTINAPASARPANERATMPAPAPSPSAVPSPEEDEVRVESLTRTLQGDPTNDAVVDELTERLTRLGRSMELLALLSARLEDAPPERREELLPRHRAVLERLEVEARAAGRDGEADLFRMARDAS